MTTESNITATRDEQLTSLIHQISAYIEQYHGGSVELVNISGDDIQVRLGGACVGCPMSAATLKGWVEGTIRQFFPEIRTIEAV